MTKKNHESLGDDVYIGPDDDMWHTIIYTSNGHKIYLDPDVERRLFEYLTEIYVDKK